jgi:Alpha/beta hydrolase domain
MGVLVALAVVAGVVSGVVEGALPAAASGTIYSAAATLTGPVTTGHIVEPLAAVVPDLATYGYVEQEFFASGTAYEFRASSQPADGRWTLASKPTSSAPYRTRIIVRRPASASKFNGTVIIEWMNVSGGESAPDWMYMNPALMREGYAYVGVSAQALGVEGGTAILGVGGPSAGLVNQEPDRYGSLHHPGDQYALDMFAQIGLALRNPHGSSVLGSLRPRHVVAVGESQSAFYLTGFADALEPVTHAFDGIFIHSRGGGAAGLGATDVSKGLKGAVRIRTDLHVPVFLFETQTDLTTLGYAPAQQPNTAHIRTWEVAGTSHADAYLLAGNAGILGCSQPINDGPQHEVVQAALTAFGNWVMHSTSPPAPAPFKLASTNPATYALDKHGNVIGGVRTPAVDTPVSTLSGQAPPGTSTLCSLFGSATPLSAAALHSLYPTKADYVAAYTKSLDRAIRHGYLLRAERAELLTGAEQQPMPS